MNTKTASKVAVCIVLIWILGGPIYADELSLHEKLSQDIKIQLKDVTVAEALERIGKKAGVRIVLSDEAIWKLPQGQATRLSVMLDGPLAESLTDMLNAFFMRYAVGDEEITIYPRVELEHILGRPTPKELELLGKIYTGRLTVLRTPNIYVIMNELLDEPVLILPLDYQRELYSIAEELARYAERTEDGFTVLRSPVTLAQIFYQSKYSWYLRWKEFPAQNPEIHFLRPSELANVRLDQIIDVCYEDKPVADILRHLGVLGGIDVSIEGAWGEDPMSLSMQNVTVREAIRQIASTSGASCRISGDGVYLRPRKDEEKPAESRPSTQGYVGKISIPMEGGAYHIEFMLRESDLTGELRKMRADKIRELLGQPEKSESGPQSESEDAGHSQRAARTRGRTR
jgi:hypothetical protein